MQGFLRCPLCVCIHYTYSRERFYSSISRRQDKFVFNLQSDYKNGQFISGYRGKPLTCLTLNFTNKYQILHKLSIVFKSRPSDNHLGILTNLNMNKRESAAQTYLFVWILSTAN